VSELVCPRCKEKFEPRDDEQEECLHCEMDREDYSDIGAFDK
jgi:uncharacterized protein YbaR (Trm112 family)